MEQLGYKPNLVARALASNRTNTVGLVVPEISNAWFSLLTHHIEEAAHARGLVLLLGSSSYSIERERQQLTTFARLRLDGVILARSPMPRGTAAGALPDDLPIVCVNRAAPKGSSVPSVVVRHKSAARRAAAHLFEHGHSTVACLTGPTASGPLADRTAGWRQASRTAGVAPREDLLLPVSFSRVEAYHAVSRWLPRPDRPTALFCASDELAMGAMRAAAETGIKIPDDLAIVGFDDIAEAATNHPTLTTMRQPVAEIAEHAIETLLAFRDTGKPQPDSILQADLVRRESCGCHGSPHPSDKA